MLLGYTTCAWTTCRRILRRVIGVDWKREILVERSLEDLIHIIEPQITVRIERATERDLSRFRDIVDDRKVEVFRERFKKGEVCQAAFDGDKVVGFNWANLHEYEADCETRGRLREREAYMFDGYTAPGYRQGKIAAAVATQLFLHLRDRGYRRVHGVIPDTNVLARKAWGSVGWRGTQAVMVVTIFGLKFRRWQRFTGAL
jgi:hypothetical protein